MFFFGGSVESKSVRVFRFNGQYASKLVSKLIVCIVVLIKTKVFYRAISATVVQSSSDSYYSFTTTTSRLTWGQKMNSCSLDYVTIIMFDLCNHEFST